MTDLPLGIAWRQDRANNNVKSDADIGSIAPIPLELQSIKRIE